MKLVIRLVNVGIFWLSWPVLYLILNNSQRTRGLIVSNKKILLVQAFISDGKWGLPGGGLHKGEAVASGFQRELHEELGIVARTDIITILGRKQVKENGISTNLHYCSLTVPELTQLRLQKHEIADARWFDITNLPKNLRKDTKIGLRLLFPS